MCMCVQLNGCCLMSVSILHRGQDNMVKWAGKYDFRNGDLYNIFSRTFQEVQHNIDKLKQIHINAVDRKIIIIIVSSNFPLPLFCTFIWVHSPLNSFGYWTLNKYYYYYLLLLYH